MLVQGIAGLGISRVVQPTWDKIQYLYSLGFGTVRDDSIANLNTGGLLTTVLLANLPQTILSFLYFSYNGLITCVMEAYEWNSFATSRKTLRVTSPVGK